MSALGRPKAKPHFMGRPASIEALEHRRLLAWSAPAVPAALSDKIDAPLWTAAQTGRHQLKNDLLTSGLARFDKAGRIEVYIRTSAKHDSLIKKLNSLGATINESVADMRVIQAMVPTSRLEQIARLAGVREITLPDYAVANAVTTAGDGIHKVDQVRSRFAALGIDGTGMKIGVISDGATNRASVGAELPFINVDPFRPGSGNEGTAMLEIVHDLAPGADLYFSGPNSSASMVSSINWLASQGCDVIVDDLIFFGESYFSDTAVANAAANAVSGGAVYVTSAGNFGNGAHYQGDFSAGAAFGVNFQYHRFSAGDDTNNLTIPAGVTINAFLQWSDPWGTSGNNYNLYLTNTSGTVLTSDTTTQNGNDLPFEAIAWANNTGSSVNAQIRITKRNGHAARELELFIYVPQGVTLQHNTPSDVLVGQEAADGVLATAAAWAFTPTDPEVYSSQGGSTIYTNFATQTKIVRQSLDGTAIDGVETRIGQLGFFSNPFFGTSAAAPHAAAIAALVRQMAPSLTPAQTLQVMADTALDLGSPGYDIVSGAGLYDATEAIYHLYTPAAPDLADASDTGTLNTDNLTNSNLPDFIGTVPADSYVRLLVDGIESNTVQLNAGETSYVIAPGSPLSDGDHTITIQVASSSSTAASNSSNESNDLIISIDTSAPTVSSRSFNFDVPVQNLTVQLTQDVVVPLQNAVLSLTNTTTSSSIAAANIFLTQASLDALVFTFIDLPFGALPDGIYNAVILAADITDAAGNALPENIELTFHHLSGDSNHDGRVDATDLGILAAAWSDLPGTFSQGDSTYDGIVSAMDLLALALNYQKDLFAVPE